MKRLAIIALCLLCLGGCCTCPPPPYADVNMVTLQALASSAITTDSIEWASTDSTWSGTSEVWAGVGHIDSIDVVDLRLPAIEADIVAELNKMEGQLPCRWVYGARIEPDVCPDAGKQTYSLKDGRVEFIGSSMAACAVLHTKVVKDSIWHCGPDNGVFAR